MPVLLQCALYWRVNGEIRSDSMIYIRLLCWRVIQLLLQLKAWQIYIYIYISYSRHVSNYTRHIINYTSGTGNVTNPSKHKHVVSRERIKTGLKLECKGSDIVKMHVSHYPFPCHNNATIDRKICCPNSKTGRTTIKT